MTHDEEAELDGALRRMGAAEKALAKEREFHGITSRALKKLRKKHADFAELAAKTVLLQKAVTQIYRKSVIELGARFERLSEQLEQIKSTRETSQS